MWTSLAVLPCFSEVADTQSVLFSTSDPSSSLSKRAVNRQNPLFTLLKSFDIVQSTMQSQQKNVSCTMPKESKLWIHELAQHNLRLTGLDVRKLSLPMRQPLTLQGIQRSIAARSSQPFPPSLPLASSLLLTRRLQSLQHSAHIDTFCLVQKGMQQAHQMLAQPKSCETITSGVLSESKLLFAPSKLTSSTTLTNPQKEESFSLKEPVKKRRSRSKRYCFPMPSRRGARSPKAIQPRSLKRFQRLWDRFEGSEHQRELFSRRLMK